MEKQLLNYVVKFYVERDRLLYFVSDKLFVTSNNDVDILEFKARKVAREYEAYFRKEGSKGKVLYFYEEVSPETSFLDLPEELL